MTKKRNTIKTVRKGGSSGSAGISSGAWTNAEQIKNQFFAFASSQRAGKESGDAGYWTGGRCNWGGSHNLQEDCQSLAEFANAIANIGDEKQNLTLAISEQEFNKKQQRQSLLTQLDSKINPDLTFWLSELITTQKKTANFSSELQQKVLENIKNRLSELGVEKEEIKKLCELQKEISELKKELRVRIEEQQQTQIQQPPK